jgi:predicted dehydrogenase
VIEGTTSSNPGERTTFYFHGEKGTIVFSDKGIEKWAVSEDKSIVARNDPEKCVARGGPSATSDPRAISHTGHRAQIDDLCRAVTEDREPMITGASARKAVELILAIYASAQEGREIHLESWLEELRG